MFASNMTTRLMVVVVLGLVCLPVMAQRRGPRGRVYTKPEVNQLIKNAENRSDSFIKALDKGLDKSALDGTNREDRVNERAKDFEKAMDQLRKDFDRNESYIETKPQMRVVLDVARELNEVMLRRSLPAAVEEQWVVLRRELNILASVYYLAGLRNG